MRSVLLAAPVIALAVLAAPLVAQMPTTPPGLPDVGRVEAGTYKVDGGHTQVIYTVNHMGFSEYSGQFTQPTGSLTIDPKNPSAAKVEIVFAIDKLQSTVPALDTHLKAADFFDVAKFPEGKFVSTKVVVTGKTAVITGNLTLKGVTKPVVLATRFIGAGPGPMGAHKANVGFAATTTIKRSDFNLGYGVPLVSDEVKLTINAAFEKE